MNPGCSVKAFVSGSNREWLPPELGPEWLRGVEGVCFGLEWAWLPPELGPEEWLRGGCSAWLSPEP